MSKSLRNFLLGNNFLARASLVELALGFMVFVSLEAVFDSFAKDVLAPVIGLIGGQPDLSIFRPFGVAIGNLSIAF